MTGIYFPAGRSLVPADAARFVDDFDYVQGSNTFRNKWKTNGAGTFLPIQGDTSRRGWQWGQITTAGAVSVVSLTRQDAQVFVPATFWQFNIGVKLPVLSTSAQRYIVRMGLGDAAAADFTNGVYWEYSDNINAGQWTACVAVGGVQTKIATARFADTGASGFRVFGFDASRAIFNLNGTTVASLSGLPSVALTHILQIGKTVGATAANLNVDYYAWYLAQPVRQ